MGRGFNKKINSALILLLLSSVVFGLETEYKNTLTKVELTKTAENSYDVNLHTQKKFQEPIKVIKKSDLNYYILLPETRNSTTQTSSNIADIRSITTNSYAYAGADIDNGYTKININTTKPINFNINIKNTVAENNAKPDLKEKIANEEVNLSPVIEKVEKKNSDFQEKKEKNSTLKTAKKVLAPLQTLKKEKKEEEKQVVEKAREIKIEDLVREEVESAIALGIVDGTGKNYDIEDIPAGEEISPEEMNEIEKIALPQKNTKACAKLNGQNGKLSNIFARIQTKLQVYGLSLKDAFFMLFVMVAIFFVVLFALNRKQANTIIKSKADLMEKLDKQDNLVAKGSSKKSDGKGQYFIFDKNVRQTGFCNPATTTTKRNYELSSYEPELRKNYKGPQIEQYQTKERTNKKHQQNNEYDIIQKILKEDSMMDIPVQNEPIKKAKPTNIPLQGATRQTVVVKQKVQEKPEEIQEPTILSSVEIAPERGFMCVSYNDNINLMGYIFDEVFPLYNFKQTKLENYDIKFRLSEKDDKGANFIVKIDNTRLITRVTKNSMNLEVVM